MQQKGGGLLEGEEGLIGGRGGVYSIVQGYCAFSFFVKIL